MRDIAEGMSLLWEKAHPNLSLEELDKLADATQHAENRAAQLSFVLDGLGTLIYEDAQGGDAGNFQDGGSVFELLSMVTGELDSIQALIRLGASAMYAANERRGEAGSPASRKPRPSLPLASLKPVREN